MAAICGGISAIPSLSETVSRDSTYFVS